MASHTSLAATLYRSMLKAAVRATEHHGGDLNAMWQCAVGRWLPFRVGYLAIQKASRVAVDSDTDVAAYTVSSASTSHLTAVRPLLRPFFDTARTRVRRCSSEEARRELEARYATAAFTVLHGLREAVPTPAIKDRVTLTNIMVTAPQLEVSQFNMRALFPRDGRSVVPDCLLHEKGVWPTFPTRCAEAKAGGSLVWWACVVEGLVATARRAHLEESPRDRLDGDGDIDDAVVGSKDSALAALLRYNVRDEQWFPPTLVFDVAPPRDAAVLAVTEALPPRANKKHQVLLEVQSPQRAEDCGARQTGFVVADVQIDVRSEYKGRVSPLAVPKDLLRPLLSADEEEQITTALYQRGVDEGGGAADDAPIVDARGGRSPVPDGMTACGFEIHKFDLTVVVRNHFGDTPPTAVDNLPKEVSLQLMFERVVVLSIGGDACANVDGHRDGQDGSIGGTLVVERRAPTFCGRFVSIPPDGSTVATMSIFTRARFGNAARISLPILFAERQPVYAQPGRGKLSASPGESDSEGRSEWSLVDPQSKCPVVDLWSETIRLDPQ